MKNIIVFLLVCLGVDIYSQTIPISVSNQIGIDSVRVVSASNGVAVKVNQVNSPATKVLPSSIAQSSATNNQVLSWNGSAWTPATIVQHDPVTITDGSQVDLTITGQNISSGIVPNSLDSSFIKDKTIRLLELNQSGATSGQIISWSGTAWVPVTPTSKAMFEESFSATAAQTVFTIAVTQPAPVGNSIPVRVYRNGVRLFYVASGPTSTQFTYTGTTVTTSANTIGDIITVEYLN